ncbi:MAG TPA: HAD hydrolase family protein [Candidatus Aquicultor sp.]|jgi:soluble P-type ATPase
MIKVSIPGRGDFEFNNLVLDMNGTIAVDGLVSPMVADLIKVLSRYVHIHIVTADTHGRVESQMEIVPAHFERVHTPGESAQKAGYVRSIGAGTCIAIGNGSNDAEMLQAAQLSIAVIGDEGCASETLQAADLVVKRAEDAFNLLINTNRLIATLRK